MERRYFDTEVRATGNSRIVEGYALKFNTLSEDMGGWRETISPEALRGANMEHVVAAFNHNYDKVLARTDAGTLELEVDGIGLKYRFKAPNTTAGNDLLEDLKLGNVTQSSFAFTLERQGGDTWEKRSGYELRTIKQFKTIVDVSPVVLPAYPDTSSARRSLEAFTRSLEASEELEQYEYKLRLYRAKTA